ncbi:MAG: epoxyqueuosine reductase [Candidatus Schekmanbacteria bacterium]|nr:MAG: epoxyqueuosine reductase [Candidatus Schekmanbacteria bacterium]
MDEREKNFEQLQEIAIREGASLIGVADIKNIKKTFHPLIIKIADSLPYAISIVVKLSDAIINDIKDSPTLIYKHHYKAVNYRLDQIALAVCKKIDSLGYSSVPIPSSQMVDWEKQLGHLSHRLVAREAGLGYIGRSTLFITPQYGARVRLVTILTNLPLPTGNPLEGSCKKCNECISLCPAEAITEAGYEREKCIIKLKEFSKIRGIGVSICGVCVKACKGTETLDE